MIGSLASLLHNLFTSLAMAAKMAVILSELSFVFCKNVTDWYVVVVICEGILIGKSLLVALHKSVNDLSDGFDGILV